MRIRSTLIPGLERSFGDVSAQLAVPDLEPSRFHEPGQTIWQQLSVLRRERIETRWRDASAPQARRAVLELGAEGLGMLSLGESNVVSSYLVLHLIALRFAREAGQGSAARDTSQSAYRLALLYEAGAQSYLRAAFYAGHMRVPFGSVFWKLHGENTRRAHNHFRDTGLYVVDGRGEVWQTFGDEILASHDPTYRFILGASTSSLREIFLVLAAAAKNETDAMVRTSRWTAADDAPETYLVSDAAFMPTLRLLPVPVYGASATRQTDGTFAGKRDPQLRDVGYHDPSLTGEEVQTLPTKAQYPPGMVPRAWNADLVSVRYPRPDDYPPSFLGLRADLGLAQLSGEDGTTIEVSAGLGYAWSAGLADLSLRAGYLSGPEDGFATLSLGPRLENPLPWAGLRWIDAFLPEIGYLHDLRDSWSESGGFIGFSGVTRAWSGMTGVVNAGPSLQLGARLYVRRLPLIGFFAAVGFQ